MRTPESKPKGSKSKTKGYSDRRGDHVRHVTALREHLTLLAQTWRVCVGRVKQRTCI